MVATIGSVRLRVELDRSDVRSGIEELRQIKAPNIALKPTVDFGELHELNRLFDVKIAHAGQLQKNLAFKARVDASELDGLTQKLNQLPSTPIVISARVVVDQSQLAQVADREVRIRAKFDASGGGALFDASKISTDITDAITKGFKSSKGGGFGDLLLAPLKGALNLSSGIIGTIGRGLITGITEPITAGLGKGLSTAIESAIAPSVGSSALFANKVGTAIGLSIVGAAKIELADLNDAIQNSIDNIDNGRVRRKMQSILDSIKAAPGNINQAVQETIGADNITRQNLLNDRKSGQQAKRDTRSIQAQAEEEFTGAKSAVRKLSQQPQTSETEELIKQQIAVAEVANQFRAKKRNLPDQFVQVAQAVGGKNVDVDRLPTIQADDEALNAIGANATYNRETNAISVRSSLKEALDKAELSNEQIRTLAEELSHAFDLDFGSEKGLAARSRGQVLPDRKLEATPDELRRITPELSRYKEADRGFELNGKIRAERATAQVLLERQQGDMLRLIGDIRESADLQPLIDKYKKIAQIGSSLGVDLGGSLRDDFLSVEELASSTIGAAAAGDIKGDDLKAAIDELDSAFAALQGRINDRAKQLSSVIEDRQIERGISDPFNTPELPEGATSKLIARASKGDQVYPEVRDPFLPPPTVLDRAKELGGKVKDAVFNPDRNIDIDVDALRDKAEQTGLVLYKAGLITAKAFDATAKTFNQLAASPAGKVILGAAGETGKSLGAAAKATYALASGIEAITLDLIPAGRTLKAGLKQTAVPALAFGAATQLLPGGQAIAGAGVDLAQAALGPAGGAISSNLIANANQALSFLPDAFGMQANAIEAVTTLITNATSAITAGVAEVAVPVLGGKLLTGAIGNALPPGEKPQAALPPARSPFQLPFAAQSQPEAIAVEVVSDAPRTLSAGRDPVRAIAPAARSETSAIAPRKEPDLNKARSEANAAAKRAGEIAASAIGSAKLVARTTDDIVASAKEIQSRVSAGYGALKEAIAGGNKGLAKALQQSIAGTAEHAQKDLGALLDEARSNGDRKALVEIGQVKGRINRNLGSTKKLDRKVEAIDVGAEDITGEGLARASGEAKPGIFSQLKNRLNSLLPLTDKRLAAIGDNYERIIQAIGEVSDATVGFDSDDIVPGLRVADRALQGLGAEAFYDAENNVILINKELAAILANGPEELKKYAEKLRPLIQEGRHALQTVGGGLDIESAATGANVTLDKGENLSKADRLQVERSVGAARGNADPNAVRRLETDALAFESKTSKIVDIAAAQARKEAGPAQRPIAGLKQRFEQLRDAVSDRVLDLVGQAKATVEGSKALVPIGLAPKVSPSRPLTDEDNAEIGDRLEQGQARAQRQADSAKSQIDSGRRAARRAVDADESFRSAERKIARDTGGVATTGTVTLREEGDETIGLFSGIKGIVKSFNAKLAEELKQTSGVLAQDAAQTVLEIRNSRVKAENSGDTVTAKRLGGLEKRAESAIGGIDALREQPLTDPKQREKLRGLKDEIGAVYAEIQRPLPIGGGDGLLGVGDQIGGLIGKFKGLGAALLALPFALEGLSALKQFGKDSIDAAVNYDRLRTSLANSSGGTKAADRDLAFIDNQASVFGTDLKSGREGFTGLRASTKGTSVEGAATEDLFTGLTQASTVLGLSQEKQSKAFLALQQTASKGKLSAEELRGQLAEALPGAFGVAARSIGVTEAELNKLLETGALTSDEFLPKFGRQLKAEFGGSAVEASNNLQSSLFRTDAAFLKLKESSGATIAPAIKLGADATTGALNALNQSIGVVGPVLALLGVNILASVGGPLLKLPIVSKVAAAGLVGLKEAALAVGKSLGPVALQFIAVQAAIELFGAAKDMFGLTEEGQRFKQLADTATKEIDRITGKLDAVKTKSADRSPSKGVDLTFGIGGAIGTGAVRTDDVLKQSEKADKPKSFLEGTGDRLLNSTPFGLAAGLNKAVTKFRGGEGATTIGDLQKQREGLEFDKFQTSLDDRAAIGFNTAPIADSLRATKAIDDKSKDLRSQRNVLAAQPGKSSEVAAIDAQLKTLGTEREAAFKTAGDAQGAVAGALREARAELKGLEDKGNLTDVEKSRVDRLKQSIGTLESSQKNIDKLGTSIGTTGDATRKLVTTLADLEDKLASIEEKANLTLNIKLASNARESLADFGTNQFAGSDAAVKDAKAQGEKAKAVFEQTRTEIDKAQKDLGGDDVARELSLVNVGATGRKLSLDSSEEDLKTAAKSATPQQKDLIERVDSFRKTRAKLPTLDRDAAQAELQEKQATQAGALARVDDKSELRNQANAKSSSDRQVALNKELIGNTIKSDEDLAIKRAALEKQSVADRASAVKAQISSLDELKSQGVISAEEYTKRRRALANEEISIATDASNAEVSVKQAANAKILKDLERATRDRNLKSKITNNDAQIQLAKDELNPAISDEKLAVKSAQVGLDGTRSEIANAQKDLEGLNKAFAAGALNQEAYNDQAAQLKGTISDLGVKQAQGELAVRKAINAELLKQFERAKATRELDAKLANNAGRSALLGRQLRGPRKLESEDVAIESAKLDSVATDRQTVNAQKDLADLNQQYAKGLIKVSEFEDKSKELKGTLSDLGVQKLTNELAVLEAQNAKTLKSFERLNAEANAKLEVRTFARSDNAKRTQFQTGQVVGLGGAAEQDKIERDAIAQRIRLRSGEIAGVKRLVQQRVLTESEGRDRILGIESDIRSQKTALLDSQIKEYERVSQAQIDEINRVAEAQASAFDAEKTRLSNRSALLEKQSSLLTAQADLEKAVSDARIGTLSGREATLGNRRGLAAKLKDEGTGKNEKAEILRQTGGASELTLLKNQQAIAREIEAEKVASLDRQQAFARQQLAQEQARLRIAQKIAEIEAKSAQVKAIGVAATAKIELAKAEKTGDKNQIAAAKAGVAAADLGVSLATENVGLTKLSGEFQEKELAVKAKTLGVQQNAERADLVRSNRSAEDARRLDFAQTLDRTGEKGFVGNYAVAGEVKVEPMAIADSIGQINSTLGGFNLPGLEELLRKIAENTSGKTTPTVNNFNGGQDAIQQYIALQQAQQASKARG